MTDITYLELAPGIYDPSTDPDEDDPGIFHLDQVVELQPGIFQTYTRPTGVKFARPWRVDLCIGWKRVAVCTAYRFRGTQHRNSVGDFTLEASPEGIPPAGAPVAAVETVTATDNFDRANGTLGASWLTPEGTWTLSSNEADPTTFGGNTALNTTVQDSDCYAEVSIVSGSVSEGGPVVRASADGANMYHARWSSGGNWILYKRVAGTFTLITYASDDVAPTLPVRIRLEAEGTTLRVYNGSELVIQAVDTDLPGTGGLAGIRSGFGNQNFDDFEAGTYKSPSSTPFDPRDVDTIRLCAGNKILFGGYVAGDDGGFWIEDNADGQHWNWTGQDAWWLLARRIAYPNPAQASAWSTTHDTRTGIASSVLAAYLDANMGNTALTNRRVAQFQTADETYGPNVTFSARFETLYNLAQRIAIAGDFQVNPEIGFDGTVTMRLARARNLSEVVVFSNKGDLLESRARFQHPEATYCVTGGTGTGTSRLFRASDTGAKGVKRREVFSDASALEQADEVQFDANAKTLAGGHRYAVTSQLTAAMTELAISFGLRLGDKVGVSINGRRYALPIESVSFDVTPDHQIMTPQFGDAVPNHLTRLLRTVDQPERTSGIA